MEAVANRPDGVPAVLLTHACFASCRAIAIGGRAGSKKTAIASGDTRAQSDTGKPARTATTMLLIRKAFT